LFFFKTGTGKWKSEINISEITESWQLGNVWRRKKERRKKEREESLCLFKICVSDILVASLNSPNSYLCSVTDLTAI